MRVGSARRRGFPPYRHGEPMLSLCNAFDGDEAARVRRARARAGRRRERAYTCELKIDGLAISLHYENGRFVRGGTRGDGSVGEDVTREPAHDPLDPAASCAATGVARARRARRGLLAEERLRRAQRAPRSRRQAALRQPAQHRVGRAAPARPRLTAERRLSFFAYAVGEIEGGRASGDAVRVARVSARAAASRRTRTSTRCDDRRRDRLHRALGRRARDARLRDRRHRGQSRRSRAAREARLRRQGPALGDRLQVSRARSATKLLRHRESTSAAPARSTRTPSSSRCRSAASPCSMATLHNEDDIRPQGYSRRRRGRRAPRRRRHSAGRRSGARRAQEETHRVHDARPTVRCAASPSIVPRARRWRAARTPRARRSVASACGTSLARRDGHRRRRRRAGVRAGRRRARRRRQRTSTR